MDGDLKIFPLDLLVQGSDHFTTIGPYSKR